MENKKSLKELMKEKLLKDPYKELTFNDYGEDAETMEEAVRETKDERENSKRKFDKIRALLGE